MLLQICLLRVDDVIIDCLQFFLFFQDSQRGAFFLNPHLLLFLLLKLVPLSIIGFLDSCDVGQDPPVQKVARREVLTRNRLKHYVYTSICA